MKAVNLLMTYVKWNKKLKGTFQNLARSRTGRWDRLRGTAHTEGALLSHSSCLSRYRCIYHSNLKENLGLTDDIRNIISMIDCKLILVCHLNLWSFEEKILTQYSNKALAKRLICLSCTSRLTSKHFCAIDFAQEQSTAVIAHCTLD